jgi:putative aldouronate transport system substrate-binding protein
MGKWKKWTVVLLATLLVFATGCSSGTNESNNQAGQGTQKAPAGNKKESIDPFGKYETPIQLTTVREIDSTFKFEDGDSIDNNIWYKAYKEELGIEVKNLWTVDKSQMREKINVTIASGDIPDLMFVSLTEVQRLIDADLIADMTKVYEDYAAPLTKEVMMADGGTALDSATFNGKLMALPRGGVSTNDNVDLIWVRQDWLEKLKLPEPKTVNDVRKIAEAFVKQDPDGNQKDDTFGIGISNQFLKDGFGSLVGFFNGFQSYPTSWIKNSSGKLVDGSTLENTRLALQELQNMYKDGLIDKEFGVKAWSKVGEDAAAGKIGLVYGRMWNPLNPLNHNRKNDPKAQWQAYPIVSVDGKPAKAVGAGSVPGYFVVKKGFKHPEAVVKMMNSYIDKGWGKSAPESTGFHKSSVFKFAAVSAAPSDKNLKAHLKLKEALKNNDPSKLNTEETGYYGHIQKYRSGDDSGWGFDRVFGPTGSYSVIDYYVNNNLIMPVEFYGAPTPTIVERGSTLEKMQLETFTKIIMGENISSFDKFVEDWKKLGGNDITKEVNEWYSSRK